MAEAALYPAARWHPLGAQRQRRMTGHDIVCLHTMVGYLVSTDRYFRISNGPGFRGTESHYGVGGRWGPDLGGGLDGAVWQWQDRAYSADANLDGWRNVISIETADNGGPRVEDIPPWTDAQCEALARILAWESSPEAHAKCPPSWECRRDGIPLRLIPDTKPGRRGVGYHAQGVPGVGLVPGGVAWSESRGKQCPTRRRITQIPDIIARARVLRDGPAEPVEDDMPLKVRMRAGRFAGQELDLADAISYLHQWAVQIGSTQKRDRALLVAQSRALGALARGQQVAQEDLDALRDAVAAIEAARDEPTA